MPQSRIQRGPLLFGNIQQSGHEELAGAAPLAVNVVVDAAGAVHRRPGLQYRDDGDPLTGPESDPGLVSGDAPIVALHTTATGRVFAVDGFRPAARIYEIRGYSVVNLSLYPDGELTGPRRPIIAETEAMLVITAGGAPQKVLLNSPAVSSRLGGGPPSGSHVIAHDSRLLINDVQTANTNMIRYSSQASGSSIAGHEDWTGNVDALDSASFFSASARPDPVVALRENTNDVFAFGSTNLQIFVKGSGGYNFTASNAIELGCSAPYSIIKVDQNFAFVDQFRRIVLTDGRDYQVISSDIQQTLDDIGDLSGMFGYRVTLGPVDALCWCALRDGRTFVYQTSSKGWSLWQGWNDGTNNFSPWVVRCALRVPETGEMLVGGAVPSATGAGPIEPDLRDGLEFENAAGNVWALSRSRFYDYRQSRKIVARVDTGFIDRGTSGRKLCRALRLTWRGTPSTDTAAFVEWRDDNGPWEEPRQIELGQNSETILRSLGVYRRRQWRVTFSGSNELVLARAEEEFETLWV